MLDALKAAGALAGLMKNKDAMRGSAERIKVAMRDLRCEGAAGGGAVRVSVSGEMQVLSVRLAPALAGAVATEEGGREAERMIVEATNEALRLAKEAAQRIVSKEAEAMGLGDLLKGSGGGGAMTGPLAGLLGG